jgi:hypothetical protein
MIKESEVIPSMMIPIDTDKFEIIRATVGAPVDAAPSIVWGLLMDVLTVYEIYHRGWGWVERQLFKHDAKKKGGVEQKG